MIKFVHHGDFKKTTDFLTAAKDIRFQMIVEKYANEGVQALARETPKDSGLTSESWDWEIQIKRDSLKIYWTNSRIVDGIPVVILLQYGHATRGGTFVEGRNFINKAIAPTFDAIAENLWKEVTGL